MTKNVRAPWVAACSIAAGALAAESSAQTLTRKELATRVVGNTIHYLAPGEEVFEFLGPQGVLYGHSSKAGAYRAHWRLLDRDLICFEHADPMQSGCVAVVLRPGQIEFHRRDGVVEGPFEFLAGDVKGLRR